MHILQLEQLIVEERGVKCRMLTMSKAGQKSRSDDQHNTCEALILQNNLLSPLFILFHSKTLYHLQRVKSQYQNLLVKIIISEFVH